ncbi:tetratricopeptide repeat protein [Lentzea tibetensis]|uniref:Tetratricopeptide repeat protein n=1 Tax=Lentzea tibetensis TaxID=2591470 RepID=A0A563ESL8_9PSEU|nr:BTAD domain-containing putative transcriptional regulator [Lentzea tibetensis]TWP50697.1 tetratricopeptide repeat protein [Lentzea tibetensis]
MIVEFRVLGPVDASIDGRTVALGPARQRCVLAALLVDVNRVVLVDQLIDRVWGENRPYRVRGTLHSYLSRLRKVLGDDPRITQQSGGYLLAADESTVDLHRFRRLVGDARTAADERALVLFEQALELWRGEAFAGLDVPWLARVRAELERERTAAVLDHIEVALRLGLHATVLPKLSTVAGENPLDERLAGQLMLALYRSGRQAEAQAHYQVTRTRLAEELGTDPSAALRQLHHQILTADPALSPPTGKAAPVGRSAVPRQLPPPPGSFIGREDELDQLTAALDVRAGSTVVISAVRGAGGIGKTWLVLQWAYQNLARFPDGQLHVNLRGFDPTGQPAKPETALRGFLDALGVESAAIPLDPDAQGALYRSLVADRRMLIVLDNARDTNQVTPLLPGSPTCTVLITSRNALAGLVTTQGARPVALDVLAHDDAVALLVKHLGTARVAADPAATDELIRRCAGLPLALGIVAGRAATHPDLTLAALAEELCDHAGRLDALDTGEAMLNLRAVFSWSYDALTPDAAALFGLLGLAPGPDFSVAAAASLTSLPVSRTAALMRELESAHLVQQPTPGRFRTHDLMRLYATEQARLSHTEEGLTAALRRLVDHYVHTGHAADKLLNPHRPPVEVGEPVDGSQVQVMADQVAAQNWFTAEHPNLLAAQQLVADRAWHTCAWQLAWVTHTYHWRRGQLHDNLAVWRIALAACEQMGDVESQTWAHRLLGYACVRVGLREDAMTHLKQALALAERTDDIRGQADARRGLAWALEQQGEDRLALEHAKPALELYEKVGQPAWVAWTLNQMGWYEAKLGEYENARAHCEAALDLYRVHTDHQGEANTLDSLGYIAHRTGELGRALDYYQQALALFRDLGHTYLEADTLDHLALTQVELGRLEAARRTWQRALELYEAQHRTTAAERVRSHLADTSP